MVCNFHCKILFKFPKMIVMSPFLRPKKIIFLPSSENSGILAMSLEDDVEISDVRTGIKTIKKFSQLYLNPNIEPTIGINFGSGVNGPEWLNLQTSMQEAINNCKELAERILGSLRAFLCNYYGKQDRIKELMQMEFMELRNELSDNIIVKDHSVQKIERLKSKVERKFFTRTFFNFITDRNVYTHGHLHVRWPEKEFIIQYIENKKDYVYCEINKEFIQSYINCYKYLKLTLEELSKYTR